MPLNHPALRRFLNSPSGVVGGVLTSVLLAIAVLTPWVNPYELTSERNYALRLAAPSLEHLFGADGLGRDIFTLVSYGLGTSLIISLGSVALGLIFGVSLGLLAGYYRRWVDALIGWLTDVMLAFPSILLAIAVVTVTGPNLWAVTFAVGLVQIPRFIRLTRGTVLSVREKEFVQAAQAAGASPMRVMLRHILPASLGPIIVQATLGLGTATLEAAGLGFLGLGAQPPNPELGTMLSDAFKGGYSFSAPWTIVFPGLMITTMVMAFNLLGDGLQAMLNPQSQ